VKGWPRVGDVPGHEIPSRYFRFLRSGDPRPLEPVMEHNRLDLVSLAAVTARAVHLAHAGPDACRDHPEALALGRVYERAGNMERAEHCYRRASASATADIRAEALYRLGLTLRRSRRFNEAADAWRALVELTDRTCGRQGEAAVMLGTLRQFAVEALAIHHEHRDRDLTMARELAMFALEEVEGDDGRRADGIRHRLARLDRKIQRRGLFA
jgi:tetratricopeptide (TPR) repeat protein